MPELTIEEIADIIADYVFDSEEPIIVEAPEKPKESWCTII